MKKWPLSLKNPGKTDSEKRTAGKAALKSVPQKGEAGSLWEDRGDRYHCGIDLYAPENTEVLSIEEGSFRKPVS